jgi:ABC-type antimicrobial peptide transport system permease subunit
VKNITIDHTSGTDRSTTQVFTQPLGRLHLYSRSENGQLVAGRIEMVKLFAAIAAFILLIACINFMNLSTARSEKRAKEVGIRKVVGARKSSLITQFIGESIMLALVAFIIALAIVQVSLDGFNDIVGVKLGINFSNPYFWVFSLAFILFTGLVAGSYPAFYLSSTQPVKVLKGTFKNVNALITPRKVLVILQFTFAITLIICTVIVERQVQYAQDRDSGYNRNNLVYTFAQGDVSTHYDLIRNDLLRSGAAVSVTRTSSPITKHWSDSWGFTWTGSTEADKKIDFVRFGADMDFLKTTGATLVKGRDINVKEFATDTAAMLLNESAAKAMHMADPLGKTVSDGDNKYHIVGVIKDFILESPYEEVKPMVIEGPSWWFQVIHFRLNPANTTAANIAKAEKIFKQYNPQYPFEYVFADESYAQKFREEQRTGTLAALFAGLTIFISCLGLFGLAAYMAENRIKEIGVRKVLGASVASITALLSKDFIKLVLISILIASPVAWFAMNNWLLTYNYRIQIGWWVFAASGLLAVLIALLTVSYQAIKAAIANPVKSLRSE